MNPSRFWGKDLASALRAVRGTLGPDALFWRRVQVQTKTAAASR